MLKMEPFVDSFVEGLGLDRGYTMIVVNPKWSANLASYGFRAGYSVDEMALLQSQVGGAAGAAATAVGDSAPSWSAARLHSAHVDPASAVLREQCRIKPGTRR